MKYVTPEQLIGKEVVTSDGFDLGKFVDAEISEVSGKLSAFVVEPNVDSEYVNKLNVKDGKLKVPYSSVMAVNDLIVVDKKSI